MHRHLIPKFVGAVVLLTAFGGGAAYAFTASNTVQGSNAGEGNAAVSGYNVYNIEYAGVPAVGNPDTAGCQSPSCNTGGGPSSIGTMVWFANPPTVGGLTEQDGVQYVAFQLAPDNAHWAAVQLYNAAGTVTGGGGASSCTEKTSPTANPAFWGGDQGNGTLGEGSFDSTAGIWICNVHATAAGIQGTAGGPVPVSDISYIDVEAAQ
jgi:hypothetical protein